MRVFEGIIAASLLMGSACPALAQIRTQPAGESFAQPALNTDQAQAFERNRQSILAQAGQYRVHFEMRENVSFDPDYDPLEEQLSGGSEIVRVIQDDGDHISLQHILVIQHEGQPVVVKHWRQDWVYQPREVLTYVGPNQWKLLPVAEQDRLGAWSQTVWQTDDSPRYGGVGRWTYDHGISQWTSGPTWRPLARRDAVRQPVYDRYLGTNRHVLRHAGWVHLQDNMKMAGSPDGQTRPVVQEDVINTYAPTTAFDPTPGDEYWTATKEYWAGIRATWDEVARRDGGLYVPETAETGAVTGIPLMELADQVQKGQLTTAQALAEGCRLILEATTRP